MSDGLQPGEVARVLGGRADERDVAPEPGELEAGIRPWGERAVVLRVGSLAVRIGGLDDRLHALIERNYEGFLSGSSEVPTLSTRSRPTFLQVERSRRERYLYLPREEGRSEEARLDGRSTDDGFELWSYFFAGWFDRQGHEGCLLLCEADELDLTQAIENYLRFLLSAAALEAGGFLLHASGAVRDGRAVLFFGPSGAGKSTAVANAPEGTVRLGDDLVLVEPVRHGYRACGVPFRGSFAGDERNASDCAPLALACRLFHAEENRLDEAPRAVQAAELLGELPFLVDDEPLRARAGEVVASFVGSVPVRRLHLRADGSHWELIDRELA